MHDQTIQLDEAVSMAELSAFAGNDTYPKKWEKYHENKSFNAGFNVWAALWGVQWFIYRRLYIQGLIALCLEFGSPVGFIILSRLALGDAASQQYGTVLAYCAVFIHFFVKIGIGYWSNIVFYKKAVSTIRKISELKLDNERHLSVLGSLGQPSFQSLLVLYLVFAILKIGFEILR
jgi:hypothetical protein